MTVFSAVHCSHTLYMFLSIAILFVALLPPVYSSTEDSLPIAGRQIRHAFMRKGLQIKTTEGEMMAHISESRMCANGNHIPFYNFTGSLQLYYPPDYSN